jgi:hypothetical protein
LILVRLILVLSIDHKMLVWLFYFIMAGFRHLNVLAGRVFSFFIWSYLS